MRTSGRKEVFNRLGTGEISRPVVLIFFIIKRLSHAQSNMPSISRVYLCTLRLGSLQLSCLPLALPRVMYIHNGLSRSGTCEHTSVIRAQECGSHDALSTKARSSGRLKSRFVPAGIFFPSLGSRVKCGATAPTNLTLTSLERSHSAKCSPKGYACPFTGRFTASGRYSHFHLHDTDF